MPGLNTTGTPSTADYNLGRGALYFASLNDAKTALSSGYRHLGNAPEFSVSVESETLEHQSSLQGLKITDKEVVISQKINLSLTLDEINFENLATFFSGQTGIHTNTLASTAISESQITPGTTCEKGRWYDIVTTTGSRVYNLDPTDSSGLDVFQITGGTGALTEGDDYILDYEFGRVFLLSDGDADITKPIFVSTDAADAGSGSNVTEVQALTTTSVIGSLKFISINPANGDRKTEYQFHQVSLKAEGDFALIGDEFTTMGFSAVAEANTSIGGTSSPTLTVRLIPTVQGS